MVEHVGHAHTTSRHLGAVCWADTFLGSANRALSKLDLFEAINALVKIKYNVAAVTDEDAPLRVDAEFLHSLNFLEERVDVHNTTRSYEVPALRADHTRWQDVDVEFLVVVNDGVPRVVTALSPAAKLRLTTKDVNELTFALIPPLRT